MGGRSIAQLAESVLNVLDDAMASYAHMGRALYIAMLELEPGERAQMVAEYAVQDECCPCGSGRRFS